MAESAEAAVEPSSPSGVGALSGGDPAVADGDLITESDESTPTFDVPDWAKPLPDHQRRMIANKKYAQVSDLADAYIAAQKRFGNTDNMIELPDMESQESIDKFYSAAGRPETPDGYTMVENMDAGDSAVAGQMSSEMHKLGLTDKQWLGVQQTFQKIGADGLNSLVEKKGEQTAADFVRLREEWGEEYDGNINSAKQAVNQAGIPGEFLEAIEEKVGTYALMSWANNMRRAFGEHQVEHGTGSGAGQGFVDPATATAEKDRMLSDPATRQKYADGDRATVDKVHRLMDIASQRQDRLT